MFSDWLSFFWPQLTHPWEVIPHVFNLPWLWVALQPLRLLGQRGALLVMTGGLLLSLCLLSRRLHLPAWRFVLLLFSAPVWWCWFMGQIDGLLLLAFVAPPALAVFAGMAKPQVAIGAAVRAFRQRPILAMLLGVLLLGTAFAIWRWPLIDYSLPGPAPSGRTWNYAIWPWGLVLVPWLFKSLRKQLAASPLLFPYAGLQSMIGPLLFTATLSAPVFVGAWLFLWWRLGWMLGLI
jgi:hypothetical protein